MNVKTKNKKVDIVYVNLEFSDDSKSTYSFEQLLNNSEINEKEFSIKFKNIKLKKVYEDSEILISIIQTSIDKGLPPKYNKKTKEISSLDLGIDDNLAYGNILLYSKKYKCLFYEVNKYSIYLDVFKEYLYKCWNNSIDLKSECSFNINFISILKRNEINRALNLDIVKSLKIKIYQPKDVINELKRKKLTLEEKIKLDIEPELENTAKLNSEFAEIEYFVNHAKKKGGLNLEYYGKVIKNINDILKIGEVKNNIQKFEVEGYTSENNHKIPINILGDIYSGKLKLSEPRLDIDLQINERTEKIKNLYYNEIKNLEKYL